jgi:hypothetical protein
LWHDEVPRPSRPPQDQSILTRQNREGKNKEFLDLMAWGGLDYAEAAQQIGMSARQARRVISKPHAIAYLRGEKVALRSSLGPKVLHRLMVLAVQDLLRKTISMA